MSALGKVFSTVSNHASEIINVSCSCVEKFLSPIGTRTFYLVDKVLRPLFLDKNSPTAAGIASTMPQVARTFFGALGCIGGAFLVVSAVRIASHLHDVGRADWAAGRTWQAIGRLTLCAASWALAVATVSFLAQGVFSGLQLCFA